MPEATSVSVVPEAPPRVDEPLVSIVIPARDAEATLAETLSSIGRLERRACVETIVVDDGSRDRTAELARAAGARVVAAEGRGVSDARNTGARHARGAIVFFVDADVVLPADAVDLVVARLDGEGYDAVTGRLSAVHRFPGFGSQYKNLWMAYTYEALPDDVSLFYTSAAAIRRNLFLELGGFTWRFERPSVEDTAFGQVLGDRGCRVRAEKALAVEHLKSYRPWDVLRVDFARARDLTKVFLARLWTGTQRGNTSSVPTSFMISVPLPPVALSLLVAAVATGTPRLAAAAVAIVVLFWGCNGGFLGYLLRHRGFGFFLASHAFLVADAFAVDLGIAAGMLRRRS